MPDTPSNSPTRTELEVLWRAKLIKAQREYSCASAKWHKAMDAGQDGQLPRADGTFTVSKVAQAEDAARREYARVLGIFMDLVIKGQIPPAE